MSALIPFLALDQICEQVQTWANQRLTSVGFRIVQTFDLQVARLAHQGCTCPHHGTDQCNCQMVVLLVYPKKGDPVTLVIHGQEGKSWLSLVSLDGKRIDPRFEVAIQRELQGGSSDLFPGTEAVYENARPTI